MASRSVSRAVGRFASPRVVRRRVVGRIAVGVPRAATARQGYGFALRRGMAERIQRFARPSRRACRVVVFSARNQSCLYADEGRPRPALVQYAP